jgi:hypothetical protein
MGTAVGAAESATAGTSETRIEGGAARELPVLPALAPLFPYGAMRRGSTVVVGGSASLLIALLAGASEAGSWCAVVGLPAFGAVAAAEAGVALDRLALVPAPGPDWPTVTAALLDALDLVVIAPSARVRAADARRLAARARQRGAVLLPYGVPTGAWEGADLRLTVVESAWTGLGAGWGHLTARQTLVRADGRGQSVRARHAHIWLPHETAGITPAPDLAPVLPLPPQAAGAQANPAPAGSAPGRALPIRAGRIGPDRGGGERVGADRPGPAARRGPAAVAATPQPAPAAAALVGAGTR